MKDSIAMMVMLSFTLFHYKRSKANQKYRRNAVLFEFYLGKSLDLWKVLWYVFVLQKEVQRT